MRIKDICTTLAMCLALNVPGYADEFTETVREHAMTAVKPWLSDAILVDAIKAQNAANANLSQAEIEQQDKQWQMEIQAPNKPLIDKLLNNPLSQYLKEKTAQSNGLYTEIFVMDSHGLNVGQSEVTSDYWQGDEAKWQKTYQVGPDAVHVSDVEQDESTQKYQSQLSMTVVDPSTGEAIGAITIGVDVGSL